MGQPLVLSLFPGIGLLDMAFEEEGFCVVRGPDVLWGGDIRRFHIEMERFEGVIGSPPCQPHSPLAQFGTTQVEDLTGEFWRIVDEGWPDFYVTENVATAPIVDHESYAVSSIVVNNRWFGGIQQRKRRVTVALWRGERGTRPLDLKKLLSAECVALEPTEHVLTVTSAHQGNGRNPNRKIQRVTVQEATRYQGLPDDFLARSPLTAAGKLKAIANGVPLPMGRAIARSVNRAMGYPTEEVA